MAFARSQYLVETDWLAQHLEDPNVRVLECTVYLHALPEKGFRAESGRAKWAEGHIPGAGFADLIDDLSDRTSSLLYMMPPATQFAEAMQRSGVGDGVRVVLYDRAVNMWAARVWWMLRALGFEDAAVMDGGWEKWVTEERPVSVEPCRYPPARFHPRPRSGLIVGKAEVRAALGDTGVRLVNALTPRQHAGRGVHYGRPGRIPGSACVPALMLVAWGPGTFQRPAELRAAFDAAGVRPGQRVITYCGGGIAAACDAFVLTLLGHDDVAVYDGSLAEWSSDHSLPMETG